MKKILLCSIIFMSLCSSALASAPKFYLNSDYHIDVFNQFESGTGFNGGILLEFLQNNYVDIGTSTFSGKFLPTAEANPKYLSEGTFDISSVNIGYRGEYNNGSMTTYDMVGVNYNRFTNEPDQSVTDYYRSTGYKYEEWIDVTRGFYGGMGFLLDLSGAIQLDIGIKYVQLYPDVHKRTTDLTTHKVQEEDEVVNLTHLAINIGFQL